MLLVYINYSSSSVFKLAWQRIWVYICYILLFAVTENVDWTPQYGTVEYPKSLTLSPEVKEGDVYKRGHNLYKALKPDMIQHDYLLDMEETAWRLLQKGSYEYPHIFTKDEAVHLNEIHFDPIAAEYFTGRCSDKRDAGCMIRLDEKSEWMRLLREGWIGNMRLGDIILPSTHDSGSWGSGEDFMLVDRTAMNKLAEEVTPATLVNWTITQESHLGDQLMEGFRTLDLRIADMESENSTFHWYHTITNDPIFEGLEQIRQFAENHQEEVVILIFKHFVRPGDLLSATRPMLNERKDELSDILLNNLGDKLTPKGTLSNNPTMNEVLDQGTNLIALMEDSYIRGKDDRYWSLNILHQKWELAPNPEDLFQERSEKLKDFKENYTDMLTEISGCNTSNNRSVAASLVRAYDGVDWAEELLEELFPGITDADTDLMSFEGLYMDLITMAREGTNSEGMRARHPENYSNGASVDYSGVDAMLHHWLARPGLYKVNSIYVDAFQASKVVDICIAANKGEIIPEATLANQGSTRTGYYEWAEEYRAIGGAEAHSCSPALLRYRVTSEAFSSDTGWIALPEETGVSFHEGEYPPDAVMTLSVFTDNDWQDVLQEDVTSIISGHNDMFIRSALLPSGGGFVYLSLAYNTFGDDCYTLPDDGYFKVAIW